MLKYALRLGIIKNSNCEYDEKTYNKYKIKNRNNIISGKDFKKIFPNYKAIKIIGNNRNNFEYKLGINVDNFELDKNECSKGGLYFCDLSDLSLYLDNNNYGDKIAIITIDDNNNIFMENKKCKSDKLYINKILSINEYINNLTNKDKVEFIKKNGLMIKFIKYPSKEIQLEAVKQNGYAIKYIEHPDKEIQLEAIKQNADAIYYIDNPDKHVKFIAELLNDKTSFEPRNI